MKPADVLIIKRNIQVNEKSDLNNIPILDIQKRLVKVWKNFVRKDKNEKKSSSSI